MKIDGWYSSRVRLACLIESMGGVRYQDSVFLFRARGFDEAFKRALEIGRSQEETYCNGDNQEVRWVLKGLVSLDRILVEDLDGVEVYSEPNPIEPGVEIPFDVKFHPEESEPTQTF